MKLISTALLRRQHWNVGVYELTSSGTGSMDSSKYSTRHSYRGALNRGRLLMTLEGSGTLSGMLPS